ncbi:phosphoenolpyruvate--protein phosphotransferase [Desulfoferula mesophila]|uniref:Phosphoenolpyruvate-protein phosphotransferase n=1 Tax=Desulfoferula mesophila TaxID=3058419 RepID=A0AAU9EGG9_9BACT|nr:phosphoenolpyruvate-protein phosphotransferase [Desulfoferula mesophilus]
MSFSAEKIMHGVGASPGIAIGRALVVSRSPVQVPYRPLAEDQVEGEVERFRRAVEAARSELNAAKEELGPDLADYAYIIEAHLGILGDKMISHRSEELIRSQLINAEWALGLAEAEAKAIFDKVKDNYIRSRASDVEYVAGQVLRHLAGHNGIELSTIREKVVVVAHDLSPAETTQMDLGWIMGFVTDMGGPTSHTAIMAQAKAIPAVVGLERVSAEVASGDFVIVDGSNGTIIVHPDEETLHDYRDKQEAYEIYAQEILAQAHLPAATMDGRRLEVGANIELAEEVSTALTYGAEAVGLFRTEFLYVSQKALPTEEELLASFVTVAQRLEGRPVNIRTLDIGGDKFASSLELAPEINPALGLRAIRYCLKEPSLFRTQLRAILRASVYGQVRVMFPLISGVGELLQARQMLEEVKAELAAEGTPFDPDLKVGIMIEVPSAVAVADLLAQHADFFSIGTNDLIQYALAIDRVNEYVAHLYQPLHPAVLRMVRQVVDAAHGAGIPVGMCGEMAGDANEAPLLLGLGLDSLSMNPLAIPRVKQVLRLASAGEWAGLADQALGYATAAEVSRFMDAQLGKHFPEVLTPRTPLPKDMG